MKEDATSTIVTDDAGHIICFLSILCRFLSIIVMHDNYQTSCIITPPHYQYGTLSIIINTQYHSTSLYLLFTSTTIIIRSLSFHPFYIFRFTFIFSTSFFTSTSIATHVPFFHRFSILSMRHQIFSGLRTSNLCKFFCI